MSIRPDQKLFRFLCKLGKLEKAKALLLSNPMIDIDEVAFTDACQRGNYEVALWLQSLCPDKYTVIEQTMDNEIIYKIHIPLAKHGEIKQVAVVEVCPICSESLSNIQTQCNHSFCEPCITTWIHQKKSCPCCRENLSNTVFHQLSCASAL